MFCGSAVRACQLACAQESCVVLTISDSIKTGGLPGNLTYPSENFKDFE